MFKTNAKRGPHFQEAIRHFLQELEESGRRHDQAETQHARPFLNLESDTAEAMTLLLKIARSRRVLEIRTSNGYSTIWIVSTIGLDGGRVTSIERNSFKHQLAQENLSLTGLSSYVDLHLGEATEIVASLTGSFDCVFFNADRVSASQ